jgi:hypothetical protein
MLLARFGLALGAIAVLSTPSSAAILKATYQFNDVLAADESGAPPLVAVDPLGSNNFQTAIVFGHTRRVYAWDGNANPIHEQAGFTLATTGLILANNYSVELVFEFHDAEGAWRRILDAQDTDDGFYVDTQDRLDVFFDFAEHPGTTPWTNDAFHHVVLTNSSGTVKAYLGGQLEITLTTTVMNITNAGDLLRFFLDNTSTGANDEFSDGRIALLRIWEGPLLDDQIQSLAANPFGVPEPSGLVLCSLGVAGLIGYRRRVRAGRRPCG